MQKKAAVDIGSNSIRYLGPNGERRLITTRLAENIISTGKLSDAAIERSIAALKELAALAAAQDAKPYAYATSAVRDAKFGSRERFLALAGEIMPVRVLSGEEEATFARIGAGIADKPDWGLIDLGGGSCQLISEGFAVSAPMGCVRAKDICDKESDGSYESMREAVFGACKGLFRFPRIRITDWIGVGGTITTLAALSLGLEEYDEHAVESILLTRERIELLSKSCTKRGTGRAAAIRCLQSGMMLLYPARWCCFTLCRAWAYARCIPARRTGWTGIINIYVKICDILRGIMYNQIVP